MSSSLSRLRFHTCHFPRLSVMGGPVATPRHGEGGRAPTLGRVSSLPSATAEAGERQPPLLYLTKPASYTVPHNLQGQHSP